MRIYRLEIIVDEIIPGLSIQDYPAYQVYRQAYEAMYATPGLVVDLNLSVEVVSKRLYEAEPWFQQLSITNYPVILVADAETRTLVARLNPAEITKNNLLSVFMQLNELTFDPVSGQFIQPNGQPVGGDGIWPGGRGGFGFSLWPWILVGGFLLSRN